MAASASSSKSSSTSSTQQIDDRVTAADQAIAVGGSGQLNVTDEFSDNVLDAFNNILDLAKNAGVVATGFATEAQKATENAMNKVTERATQSEEMQNVNAKILMNVIIYGGILGVVWILLNSKSDITKIFKGRK